MLLFTHMLSSHIFYLPLSAVYDVLCFMYVQTVFHPEKQAKLEASHLQRQRRRPSLINQTVALNAAALEDFVGDIKHKV